MTLWLSGETKNVMHSAEYLMGVPVLYGTAQRNNSVRKSSQSRIVLLVSRNLFGALS